ncbi:hypothetical protein E2C01_051540 [Portunus trituberculatus]|uniref:Uncharacterized protein n=1 Tax=Portunus trituberculatus TaxID=210409 RepID=A0A5B7GJU0_PORTR|nr:hypothetical protein [Portunus trituberculatus]
MAKTTTTTVIAGINITADNDHMDIATSPTFRAVATKQVLALPPTAGHKTPCTNQDDHHHSRGMRVFANPFCISQALHASNQGKYLFEGETHSLGNGLALVTVWEHNIPEVPLLHGPHFHLGDWEVIC